MKKNKYKNKIIFTQTFDVFNCELLVCIGVTSDEIKKHIDKHCKNKLKNDFKQKNIDEMNDCINSQTAGFCYRLNPEYGGSYYFLHLAEYRNRWEDIEVLIHEFVHFKQFLWESKNIIDEKEFEAYFIGNGVLLLQSNLQKKLKL